MKEEDIIEIQRLKLVISKFKEYDEERKRYYQTVLAELNDLRDFVSHLESKSQKTLLIRRQKEEIKRLKSIIESNNIKDVDIDKIKLVELQSKVEGLEHTVAMLKKHKKELAKRLFHARQTIAQLVYEKLYTK